MTRGPRARAWGMVLAMAVLLGACTRLSPVREAGQSTGAAPELDAAGDVVPDDGGLKPVMQGLVDRWEPPAPEDRRAVVGFVLTIDWAELHPGPGILDTSRLDAAIATAQASRPQLQLKLRILGGIAAPGWVKSLDGPTAPIGDPHSDTSGVVGRFWESGHRDAYAELHRLLAADYDHVDVLREVTMSRCSTVFAEPLIRQMSSAAAVASLQQLGYSPARDMECQGEQFDAHRVWERTRSGLALNPYQVVGDGPPRIDLATTIRLMHSCREVLGDRCVLQNNSIRTPGLEGTMATMYAQMVAVGGPVTFQTAAPERVGDLVPTLEWAASQGATAVELPRRWQELMTTDQAVQVSARLRANATST